MKKILHKLFPESLWNLGHKMWARLANFWYGRPSEKMLVIGVTGTNGKSSTCLILARILEEAGFTVGMSSGLVIKIGKDEKLNPEHMTMPGRHYLHRRLKQMVDAGCNVAIVETTSEGIKQGRHLGINYDVAVFTNLAPEHLASHEGSLEKYRGEKEKLFSSLGKGTKKSISLVSGSPIGVGDDTSRYIPKISVVNGDDEQAEHFLKYEVDRRITFGISKFEIRNPKPQNQNLSDSVRGRQIQNSKIQITNKFYAEDVRYSKDGTSFKVGEFEHKTHLLSEMNAYNALAAMSTAKALGIGDKVIQKGFDATTGIPGRMEFVQNDKGIHVLVEHAHTPDAYEKLFPFLREIYGDNRIIAVFGSAGGGRDATKRPILGKIAAKYSDILVLTEEDSYDTPTMDILEDIKVGAEDFQPVHMIEDRRKGIRKGLELAKKDDLVLVLGKGAEPSIKRKDEEIPWDDREVVKQEIQKLRD